MDPKADRKPRRETHWDKERIEGFARALSTLTELSPNDYVVVEGRNDVRSLRRLGVRATIVVGRSGLDLRGIEQRKLAAHRESKVVLLPDFDRRGREKIREWRRLLASDKHVDSITWRHLSSILRGEATGVESIARLAEKLGLLRSEMWLGPDERVSQGA